MKHLSPVWFLTINYHILSNIIFKSFLSNIKALLNTTKWALLFKNKISLPTIFFPTCKTGRVPVEKCKSPLLLSVVLYSAWWPDLLDRSSFSCITIYRNDKLTAFRCVFLYNGESLMLFVLKLVLASWHVDERCHFRLMNVSQAFHKGQKWVRYSAPHSLRDNLKFLPMLVKQKFRQVSLNFLAAERH